MGTLNEARLCRPSCQGQGQGGQGRVRSTSHSHAKKHGPGAEHEAGLEQHRARDPCRAMGKREHDLEEPGQVDVGGRGIGEGEQILGWHVTGRKDDLSQPQVEKQIRLVHRHQAAPRDKQE